MYSPSSIEPKWQKYWSDHATFAAVNPPFSGEVPKKAFVLDMFPYPSGAGLHVGHPKGYTATDVYSRYLKGKGYNVLHTMGWDAFGLPTENYAIKTGQHPRLVTEHNVGVFKRQIQELGLAYDWSREINTTDPEYYRWSQWIFCRLVERGLAYEAQMPVNWCPHLKCVLANEEIVDGKSEVGGHPVERRNMRQWVLRITDYAERLLSDIDSLDWPEGIKEQQRNWIGKSEGCEFRLVKSDDDSKSLSVYTTRVDTVFGMGWVIVAPDHVSVNDYVTEDRAAECHAYILASRVKTDQDRLNEGREKTGVFTGSYVVNPFNGAKIPVWIGDYVLGSYGTGAVMGVAAHDRRDYEFAKKYDLLIEKVIVSPEENAEYDALDEEIEDAEGKRKDEIFDRMWEIEDELEGGIPYVEDGFLIKGNGSNDELLDAVIGLGSEAARQVFTRFAETEGFGFKKTNYKLRDWIFSRQRYWGEPIPVIHLNTEDVAKLPVDVMSNWIIKSGFDCPTEGNAFVQEKYENGILQERILCVSKSSGPANEMGYEKFSPMYPGIDGPYVLDQRLPLTLPEVERYEPSDDGRSPLANVSDWVNVRLADNLRGIRETNTMPQWAGSCWYYLRFMDPSNPDAIASREALDYWKNVDCYVGGAEHAVLHLLYARFWHKVLFDIGVVPTDEPFQKLINQGLILGPDGNKMSKSKGNVVNPDALVKEYGADALRMFILSMADFRDPAPWDTKAMVGIVRFLDRSEGLFDASRVRLAPDEMKSMKLLHKTIKKVGADIEAFKFNTAISSLIILVNEGLPTDTEFQAEWKSAFVRLLHPFAPHLAEELWQKLGNPQSVYLSSWPEYDEFMTVDDEVTIAIQVNGKLRATREFLNGVAAEEVIAEATSMPEVKKWIDGKTVIREVFVPNKLLNIVTRDSQ